MSDVLSEQDYLPNMNTVVIAGKVIKVEPLTGKTPGLAVTVGYIKHWPNGGSQEIPLCCYVMGTERLEKLGWLQVGEVVLVSGEVTDKGSVYAHRLEPFSKPARQTGEGDQYLAAMQGV